jgi:hypothetical protein
MTEIYLTRRMALIPAEFDLYILREATKRKMLEKMVEQAKRRRRAQYEAGR